MGLYVATMKNMKSLTFDVELDDYSKIWILYIPKSGESYHMLNVLIILMVYLWNSEILYM